MNPDTNTTDGKLHTKNVTARLHFNTADSVFFQIMPQLYLIYFKLLIFLLISLKSCLALNTKKILFVPVTL